MIPMLKSVCVYAASSNECDECFLDSAYQLGKFLASKQIRLIYGGGGLGLMGRVADGVLENQGKVTGVIPDFMIEREWAHKGVSDMRIVPNMHERKAMMVDEAEAFIALPGGCGTFEELFEVITWKRLEIHNKPIAIANIWNFYDSFFDLFDKSIEERFMKPEHNQLFSRFDTIELLLEWLKRI